MEMETECCGMLHMVRLNSTPNQPEDNPSNPTYSAYIKDISIPVCYNTLPPSSRLPPSGRGRVGTAGNRPDYPINLL